MSKLQSVPLVLRLDRRACLFLDDLAENCEVDDWSAALSILLRLAGEEFCRQQLQEQVEQRTKRRVRRRTVDA